MDDSMQSDDGLSVAAAPIASEPCLEPIKTGAYAHPASACPACGTAAVKPLIALRDVPVFCNVLWPTREQALSAARGDLDLGFCEACGHIFNFAFDARKMSYSEVYENSLHFSQHFNDYAERLAKHLVETYDIRNKDVIDIGCGKGDFLALVCKAGGNRGVGFDKSYDAAGATHDKDARLSFVQDFYGEQYAGHAVDLLSCRHVLEHIEDPIAFLRTIRATIAGKNNVTVFFEVPNAMYTLRDLGIWDLIYEHCSYFSASSLSRLFAASGFTVLSVRELYDGQFLGIECMPAGGSSASFTPPDMTELRTSAAKFADRYRSKVEYWQAVNAELEQTKKRAVVWGGGSKGVTFLNVLKPKAVEAVVDLNPRKHGKYVPGTGHQVVGPDRLAELKPDVIIVMNEVYKDEIGADVRARGLSPEFMIA
jgi:SAM-dependent methyltransferase